MAAGAGVLVLATFVAVRIATRESSQRASVREAVERFRALPAAARRAVRGAPAPGVYVYATRGSEVSRVLGTRRHAYPARTTITVSAVAPGCVRTRWDALATRWDTDVACMQADGGWRLASRSEEHEFAGHVDRRTYRCTPASTARPADLRTGASWTSRCAIDGTTTTDSTTVVGPRTLTLEGDRRVRTRLLRTHTRIGGDTTGTGTTLTWVLPDTRLVVRRLVANASTTGTIVGDVEYEERYALTLSSPRPLR